MINFGLSIKSITSASIGTPKFVHKKFISNLLFLIKLFKKFFSLSKKIILILYFFNLLVSNFPTKLFFLKTYGKKNYFEFKRRIKD
jgi:hypothetical protein